MTMIDKKMVYVREIKQNISVSEALFFLTFKSISVQEMVAFRTAIKKQNGDVKVVKNTLLKRALGEIGFDVEDALFRDTTMVVFCKGEPIEMIKSLVSNIKDKENLRLKGGIYDSGFITPKVILELSTLPTRNELIGQLIGLLISPLTKMVYYIRSPYTSVINTIYMIKKKKEAS